MANQASSSTDPLAGLIHLLKAPSKKIVSEIFSEIFKNRKGPISSILVNSLVSALTLSEKEAENVSNKTLFIINFFFPNS